MVLNKYGLHDSWLVSKLISGADYNFLFKFSNKFNTFSINKNCIMSISLVCTLYNGYLRNRFGSYVYSINLLSCLSIEIFLDYF